MPTYQKKNWHAAEPITADAINNLENAMERVDGEIETLQGTIEDLLLMNPTVEQLSTALEINNKATYLPNSWELKASISTLGYQGNVSTFALSNYIHMNKGDIITYTGELTDGTNGSNNDYVCYLAIFDDTKTFENRDNQILFSNNTTCNYTMAKDGYIRLMFGRPSDSHKEIELSDVNKCCIEILHPSIVALREDLNKVIPTNLYAGGALTYLRTIKVADGTVGTSLNSNVCITNYIDISNYSSLVYSRCIVTTSTPTVTGMAFYDVNKDNTRFTNNNEGSITGGAEAGFTLSEITVPEYAKYARFTWNSSYGEFILYNGEDYNNSIQKKIKTLESSTINATGLPSVDITDNGKIPQVINGLWVMSSNVKNLLDQINVFLGSVETLTWELRMEYVRSGQGRDMFPVGTQFNTSHGLLGNILWDVVAHDHFANTENPSGHTMTLMTHYVFANNHRAFSNGMAIFSATAVLPAGSYSFVIKNRTTRTQDNDKRVYFTIQNDIPIGGLIRPLTFNYGITYDNSKAGVFSSNTATEASEEITFSMTEIPNAIDLGNAGIGDLNNSGCVDNGNTDYDVSDVRLWLNSDAGIGKWRHPQNKFTHAGYLWKGATTSNIKNWMITEPGFLHDLDETFLQYVCTVDYPCGTSGIFSISHEPLATYTVRDKFILPTNSEVGAPKTTDIVLIGTCLEFFANVDNTKRIKYTGVTGASTLWMVRTPKILNDTANALRAITAKGVCDGTSANNDKFVIMCTLA